MFPRVKKIIAPSRRLRTTIYGSCHGYALKKTLQNISTAQQQLEFTELPENFVITEQEMSVFLEDVVPRLDLFIYQPTSVAARGELFASARILKLLPSQARTLTFSYLHFELYNPYSLYSAAALPEFAGTYVDYAIGALVANGTPSDEIRAKWDEGPKFEPYVDVCLERNLAELRDREDRTLPGDKSIQLRFADYVEKNFRSVRLFNSMNHPSAVLVEHLAARTLKALAISPSEPDNKGKEWLDNAFIPIPAFVRKQYGLCFSSPTPILAEKLMSLSEYIDTQARYFRAIDPKLVRTTIEELSFSRPWFEALIHFK
jgi:hypothetical protein